MGCCSSESAPIVCVTGATGFLGSHLVKLLLENGFSVNATTRPSTREKCPAKIKLLENLPGANVRVGGRPRLQIFAADLNDANEGSWQAAVEGCDCVFHTASPFYFSNTTYEELVQTATAGVENVLKAAKAAGCSKCVLTSSTAAVYAWYGQRDLKPSLSAPITAEDWSNEPQMREREAWYPLSKTLAEKKAWKMAEELGIQLASINPCLIFGPVLTKTTILAQNGEERSPVNTSVANIMKLLDGSETEIAQNNKCIVDVRDVALAHLKAYEMGTWGKRFPLIADCPTWEEVTDVIRTTLKQSGHSDLGVPTLVSETSPTQPTYGALFPAKTTVDPKIAESLGISFKSMETMVADTVTSLLTHYPDTFKPADSQATGDNNEDGQINRQQSL